jgi:hypothetical protein
LKYCLDTSALIEPWVRHYPVDLFPRLWDALADLAQRHVICAPVEVRREIERQSDGLSKWAKKLPVLSEEADAAQMRLVRDIVNEHPGLVKPNSTKSQADPFVIAMAEANRVPVIAYETRAKRDAAPKIPNVCDARRISTVSFVEMLRAERVKVS